MQIRLIENICRREVMEIAAEGWNYLFQVGFGTDGQLISYEQKAFIAEEEGHIVGILLFKDNDWSNSVIVVLGYVRSEWRHQGVYTALWAKMVEWAKEKGRSSIDGLTHVENKEMQRLMEKLGREPRWITFCYDLKSDD